MAHDEIEAQAHDRVAARHLALQFVAVRSTQKHPEYAKNITRALALIRDQKLLRVDTPLAQVQSGTTDTVYEVGDSCTCAAVERHGATYRCAHQWAVALWKYTGHHLARIWDATFQGTRGLAYDLTPSTPAARPFGEMQRVAFFTPGEPGSVSMRVPNAHLVLGGNHGIMQQATALHRAAQSILDRQDATMERG